jgi:hypothetical protein
MAGRALTKQLSLFPNVERINSEHTLAPTNEKASFHDPAFATNKTAPIHRWVPWIAGFSSTFVRGALKRYAHEGSIVLDPFAGVGTTVVEAMLAGYDATGFEINPYAALAADIKSMAYSISVQRLRTEIVRFRQFITLVGTDAHYVLQSVSPAGFHTRGLFYSPAVLRKVLIVQDFIASMDDDSLQRLFRLAFAATMVRYSNYSYEPSLGRRVSSGKQDILDYDVASEIEAKLNEMLDDIRWIHRSKHARHYRPHIINDTFFNVAQHLPGGSVDIVVTSPPYLNNYHYNRNTRPQLFWLGYARNPSDLKTLEEDNFGKYWQTVRDCSSVDLTFALPETDLSDRIAHLRAQNPNRGIYGGNGWANYAASYFNDCHTFATCLQYVLKPGSIAVVVLGNSILQGVLIPTDEYFSAIAASVGLEPVTIDIPRATRVGSSIIQSSVRATKASDSHRLYEAIVVLKKGYS